MNTAGEVYAGLLWFLFVVLFRTWYYVISDTFGTSFCLQQLLSSSFQLRDAFSCDDFVMYVSIWRLDRLSFCIGGADWINAGRSCKYNSAGRSCKYNSAARSVYILVLVFFVLFCFLFLPSAFGVTPRFRWIRFEWDQSVLVGPSSG